MGNDLAIVVNLGKETVEIPKRIETIYGLPGPDFKTEILSLAKLISTNPTSDQTMLPYGRKALAVKWKEEGDRIYMYLDGKERPEEKKEQPIHRYYTEGYVRKNLYRLMQIQRMAHSGDWQVNLQTRQVLGSQGFFHLLGIRKEDQDSFTLDAYLSKVKKEDRDLVIEYISSETENSIRKYPLQHNVETSSGQKTLLLQHEKLELSQPQEVRSLFVQDVTELKRAEDLLIDERQKAKNLLEASQDAIFSVNKEGKVTAANVSFVELINKLFGVTIHISDVLLRAIPAEFRKRWTTIYLQSLKQQNHQVDLKLNLNEQDCTFEIRSSVIDLKKGEVVFFIRDITQEVALDQAHKRQEILKELAFAQAMIGYYEWDLAKGKILFSENFLHLFDLYPPKEGLTYDNFIGFLHPDDQKAYELSTRQALETKSSFGLDLRIITGKGGIRHIYAVGRVILTDQGDPEYLIGILQDITARKDSELTALQSQERLSGVLESTSDAIALFDANKDLIACNQSFRVFTKQHWSTDNPEKEMHRLMSTSFSKFRMLLQEAASSGRSSEKDIELVTPLGNFTYQVTANPIGPPNSPTSISLFIKDITDRVQLNEKVLRLMEQVYEQKVRENRLQSDTLVRGQEMERGRLSRELHDGIGQMLHALKLKISNQNETKEEILGYIGEIISETKRVCNDLMPLTLETFGLDRALKSLVEKADRETPSMKIEYFSNFEGRLATTKEKHIYRIVQELVNNSIKYSGASHVDVQMIGHEDRLVAMVEDDGNGFDPDNLDKEDGAGYGIQNIRFRSKLLNASFSLDTQPGNGCVAYLEIPIKEKYSGL